MPKQPIPSTKRCSKCKAPKPVTEFARDRTTSSGLKSACRPCRNAAQSTERDQRSAAVAEQDAKVIAEAQARAARLASDFDPLRPEDFDVSVANDGRHDPKATQEKRQEYSRSMGEFSTHLQSAAKASARGEGDVLANMPGAMGTYIAKVAEQEQRFGNRRAARSISLAAAHEQMALAQFKLAAEKYLSAKITPTGYARKRSDAKKRRTVCMLLSDLHLGAELHSLDEPTPFRAVEEARRLEYLLRQALDYKPQYREQSEFLLLLNGDVIEGQLGHEIRGGAPLTEQKVIFWVYFREFVARLAQQYPSVRVVCQPGNHGRDKVRHPGRATSRKWDGHEWELYYALAQMSSALSNVTWDIGFRAVSIVDLYGAKLGLTHGDTEVCLGHPDSAAAKNAAVFDRINSNRTYGVEFDAWCVGHFHTGRYQPRRPRVIYNAALIPPNGYARTEGHIAETCGQFLWEAVEGFPVGDLRFIEVGRAQDLDESLGTMIKPFRFSDEAL